MTAPPGRPADQAYYWTAEWQASEAAAEADLRAGRSRVFPDMGAAIAYLTTGGGGVTTATPREGLAHRFLTPDGRAAEPPWAHEDLLTCRDIAGEVLREHAEAAADPAFVALSFGFCRVATRLAYTLTLRRVAYAEDSMVFLGYRQADGSYSREGERP